VMACADALPADPVDGTQYIFGVDWGKMNDFTVIVVLTAGGVMVAMDRFNKIDYTLQSERLKALAEKYLPTVIIAEANAMGDPIIERLIADGLPMQRFTTTNATKRVAVEALALAFERRKVSILPEAVLIEELQAYEMQRTPSGGLRYSAPAGTHDDTVMALVIAWSGIASPSWLIYTGQERE